MATRLPFLLAMASLATATGARSEQPASPSPTLVAVQRAIGEVITEQYPDSASYLFKNVVHFEHSTRPYVVEEIIKLPPGEAPEQEIARGPRRDGFWLRMEEREGITSYARAEGSVDRGEFVEYTYYPTLDGGKGHLYIVLRVPNEGKQAGQLRDVLLKALGGIAQVTTED